jgi:hypothetical protein
MRMQLNRPLAIKQMTHARHNICFSTDDVGFAVAELLETLVRILKGHKQVRLSARAKLFDKYLSGQLTEKQLGDAWLSASERDTKESVA